MAFKHVTPRIGGQPIADTSTTALHTLGERAFARDTDRLQAEFIYLLGVANTAVGSWVTFNPDAHSTTLLVPDAIGPVAIAMSANVASQYGWYQIYGDASASAADVADSAAVYIDTVTGRCDDAAVTGDRVWNATWRSDDDTATNLADVSIHYPFVNDALNAGTT